MQMHEVFKDIKVTKAAARECYTVVHLNQDLNAGPPYCHTNIELRNAIVT